MSKVNLPEAGNNPVGHIHESIRESVSQLSERELLCLCCRLLSGWQSDNGKGGDEIPSDLVLSAVIVAVHKVMGYHGDVTQ